MNRREDRDMKRAERLNEPPRLLKAGDDSGHYAGFMIGDVFHAVGDWQFRHSDAECEANNYDATHIAYFDGASIDYEDIYDAVHFSPLRIKESYREFYPIRSAIFLFLLLSTAVSIMTAIVVMAKLATEQRELSNEH
jgi:hypothetical protein